MVPIRIVCTHDALDVANKLARLLGAEGHDVRLCYGRPSLAELPHAREANEAVVLIWSPDAPGAHYMLEWADNIDPQRLIELARASSVPRVSRRAPVVEFATWRGERGGRAWTALAERLRSIDRMLSPKPPATRHAAIALGLAGVATLAGALVLNGDGAKTPLAPATPDLEESAARFDGAMGVGGALEAIEPASLGEEPLRIEPFRHDLIEPAAIPALEPLTPFAPVELREPTLAERLAAFNPLQNQDE